MILTQRQGMGVGIKHIKRGKLSIGGNKKGTNERKKMKTIRSILEEVIEEYNGGFEVSDSRHIDQALAEIEETIKKDVIGENETHSNGKKLINPWVCDDCGVPEELYIRNELRNEIKSNLHKALGKE